VSQPAIEPESPPAQVADETEPETRAFSPFEVEIEPVAAQSEPPETVDSSEADEEAENPAPPRLENETRRVSLHAPSPAAETEADAVPESGKSTRIRLGQPLRPPGRGLDELALPVDPAGQRELQLGARNDGGRFDKSEPTVIDGEDLDIPAYMRKKRK
jgi:hypothetical protein